MSGYGIPRTTLRAAPSLSALRDAQFYRTVSDASVPLAQTILETRQGQPVYDTLPQKVGESVMPSRFLTPQQRQQITGAGLAQQQQQRRQLAPSVFDAMPSGMSPRDQAMMSAAATGLQLSGYQDRPITIGQGLGAMAQAGMQAYTGAQEAQRANKLQEAMLALKVAEAMKPETTSAHRNAIAMGLKVGSPEYNKYIQSATIQAQPDLVGAEMAKIGAKTIGENQAKLAEGEVQYQLFQQMDQILANPNFKTGIGIEETLPFNRILAMAGMLTPEEQETFDLTQTFKALQDKITPMLRPVGSGSTSDFEVNLFRSAAPNLAKGKNTNILLVKGAMQIHDYNRRKLAFEESYFIENKTLAGVGKAWADQNDKAINTFKTDEALLDGIESGLVNVGDVYMSEIGTFHILSQNSYDQLMGV